MSKYFYSCDWGTTNLRLRLVDASTSAILSDIETGQGITKIFSQWKLSGMDRFRFYCDILQNCISNLKPSVETSSGTIPVIVSGMASSNIGMVELPYAELPVGIDGSGLFIQSFQSSLNFAHPLILVSGVRTNVDIMRGEEVQVIGTCRNRSCIDQLFILPGTHSKHVWTHNSSITDVKTYMTGELFQLLSVNSILSNSIDISNDQNTSGWEIFFAEGVKQSLKSEVLENLFRLRVAHIFNNRTAQQNGYYLSGLLIGSELKNILEYPGQEIVLVSDQHQKKYYGAAFDLLNFQVRSKWVSSEAATVNGHQIIFERQFTPDL